MRKIFYYTTQDGKCPYAEWLYCLDKSVRFRIEKRVNRLLDGNFGDCKKLDNDLSELRFTVGAGYRIYYTQTDNIIVVLLCGGDKSAQRKDIVKAKEYLKDLKG